MNTNTGQYSAQELIFALHDVNTKDHAILLLTKMRKRNANLGQILWDSQGTIYLLLQEISASYRYLSPPSLMTEEMANHVCNVLSLIQTMAAHPNTRMGFLRAQVQTYVYPFMNTTSQGKPFEFLRLTSLGVIGTLLKENQFEVAKQLVDEEIIPKLVVCLDVGSLLSRTITAMILEKLLTIGELGLNFCCYSAERFYRTSRALERAVERLTIEPDQRLLKHIISCYRAFSQNDRAIRSLRLCLPVRFRDGSFNELLSDDPEALVALQTLVHTVWFENYGNPANSLATQF